MAKKPGQNIHDHRKISSKRPIREEDRCPFEFAIYFDEEHQGWFLRSEHLPEQSISRDYCLHKGHYRVEKEVTQPPHSSHSDSEINFTLQYDF